MTSFTEKRAGYKKTELGWLPEDWELKSLQDIAIINPKKSNNYHEEMSVSFIGMVDVSETAKLINHTEKKYKDVSKGFTSFIDSDILVAKITPCFENGKGALARGLINSIGFGSTEFHVIRARKNISIEFLYYHTISQNFRNKGKNRMTGSAGQKRVSSDFIKTYPIPIPPLPEQQKIAAILSTVDEKIDVIDAEINAGEKLKKALMRQLLTRGIGHTEFKETELGWIPKEWELKSLQDIAIINPKKSNTYHEEMSVSFIGMADVSEMAKLINHTEKKYKDVSMGFTSFIDSDILVAKITPCFENGKGAIARGLINSIGFGSTEFHVIRAKENISIDFVYYHTISQNFRNKGKNCMTGSAGQKRVSSDFIKTYPIPLPSLAEQQKIADILSTMDEKLDILREKKETYQTLKKGLMQQLLTGALRVANIHLNQETRA